MLHCGTPDTRLGGGCCIAVWWIYQGGEEGSSGTVSCLFSLGSLNPPFSYPPHMQTHKHTCRNIWVLMKICCTWCSCCEQFLEEKDIASMFIVYNHPFLSHLSCCCYLSLNSALVQMVCFTSFYNTKVMLDEQACLGDVICSMFAMTVEGLQNTEIQNKWWYDHFLTLR